MEVIGGIEGCLGLRMHSASEPAAVDVVEVMWYWRN